MPADPLDDFCEFLEIVPKRVSLLSRGMNGSWTDLVGKGWQPSGDKWVPVFDELSNLVKLREIRENLWFVCRKSYSNVSTSNKLFQSCFKFGKVGGVLQPCKAMNIATSSMLPFGTKPRVNNLERWSEILFEENLPAMCKIVSRDMGVGVEDEELFTIERVIVRRRVRTFSRSWLWHMGVEVGPLKICWVSEEDVGSSNWLVGCHHVELTSFRHPEGSCPWDFCTSLRDTFSQSFSWCLTECLHLSKSEGCLTFVPGTVVTCDKQKVIQLYSFLKGKKQKN